MGLSADMYATKLTYHIIMGKQGSIDGLALGIDRYMRARKQEGRCWIYIPKYPRS